MLCPGGEEERQRPQEGTYLQKGPMTASLWEPGGVRRAWSRNVHLVLPDSPTPVSYLSLHPTRCRCFRTISPCLRAAPGFLELKIITGFWEAFSPKWIKPWILADIPAETCMDQYPGVTTSNCLSHPLTPPHHGLGEASQTSCNPAGRRNPEVIQKHFCYPAE